ncbi:hypothetical protein LXA43DRAFT_341794 [Ganoderma leucocontextum]|nr:hypothetical protein LXA43DRAFT_341794 [Ganoderma leucocontextum]
MPWNARTESRLRRSHAPIRPAFAVASSPRYSIRPGALVGLRFRSPILTYYSGNGQQTNRLAATYVGVGPRPGQSVSPVAHIRILKRNQQHDTKFYSPPQQAHAFGWKAPRTVRLCGASTLTLARRAQPPPCSSRPWARTPYCIDRTSNNTKGDKPSLAKACLSDEPEYVSMAAARRATSYQWRAQLLGFSAGEQSTRARGAIAP